jgi:hypothetical protein
MPTRSGLGAAASSGGTTCVGKFMPSPGFWRIPTADVMSDLPCDPLVIIKLTIDPSDFIHFLVGSCGNFVITNMERSPLAHSDLFVRQ